MAAAIPVPRLFLALWPDEATREQLAQWRDRWDWPSTASPTRTERLHLTLHFIGPVAIDRIAALGQALATLPPVAPFTLVFGRDELWPGGIAVACPLSTPANLQQLHAQLAIVLGALDLPVEERAFRPHVTLARKARDARPPQRDTSLEWLVDDGFALVQSLPGGQGYRVLHRFGLAG